jgi:hypothetical protein
VSEDTKRSFPTLDMFSFDNRVYPTFGIRLIKKATEVEITRDNKPLLRIPRKLFPKEIDFNNVEHISALIKLVKEKGVDEVLLQYKIKLPAANK